MSEIQHVNVKLFAEPPAQVNWPDIIPVFHRWIQRESLPETLIDVADYAHVPAGPGILLVAHEAFYSVDNRANALGFLYNRRTALPGTTQEKLRQAYDSAVAGARLLENEPEFKGTLRFDPRNIEVFVNDRLLAPNTEETWDELKPELEGFFSEAFGAAPSMQWDSNARGLFRVRVQSAE
jgi:hypothetical protein